MKNNRRTSADGAHMSRQQTSVNMSVPVANGNFGQYPVQPTTRPINPVKAPENIEKPLEEIVDNTEEITSINTPPATVADTFQTTKPIVKSRKRTSLDEFAHRARIRPEIKAGFKAWLRGKYFAFDDEWEQLLNNYGNRKI